MDLGRFLEVRGLHRRIGFELCFGDEDGRELGPVGGALIVRAELLARARGEVDGVLGISERERATERLLATRVVFEISAQLRETQGQLGPGRARRLLHEARQRAGAPVVLAALIVNLDERGERPDVLGLTREHGLVRLDGARRILELRRIQLTETDAQ